MRSGTGIAHLRTGWTLISRIGGPRHQVPIVTFGAAIWGPRDRQEPLRQSIRLHIFADIGLTVIGDARRSLANVRYQPI